MKEFYLKHHINASTTSMYNPQGNGQVERLNGTIWKAVTLYADSHGLDITGWEAILPLALHSIRTLLCPPRMQGHMNVFLRLREGPYLEKNSCLHGCVKKVLSCGVISTEILKTTQSQKK